MKNCCFEHECSAGVSNYAPIAQNLGKVSPIWMFVWAQHVLHMIPHKKSDNVFSFMLTVNFRIAFLQHSNIKEMHELYSYERKGREGV